MDEMFLVENERLHKGNKQLVEIVGLCTQTVERKFANKKLTEFIKIFSITGVCPFNIFFNEDDQRPINCLPHPLQLLKCVRQIGVPVNIKI